MFIGFVVISKYVYLFIKYIVYGIAFPIVLLIRGFIKINKINEKMRAKKQAEQEKKIAARERNRQIKEENRKRLQELKEK